MGIEKFGEGAPNADQEKTSSWKERLEEITGNLQARVGKLIEKIGGKEEFEKETRNNALEAAVTFSHTVLSVYDEVKGTEGTQAHPNSLSRVMDAAKNAFSQLSIAQEIAEEEGFTEFTKQALSDARADIVADLKGLQEQYPQQVDLGWLSEEEMALEAPDYRMKLEG